MERFMREVSVLVATMAELDVGQILSPLTQRE